MTEIIDVLDNQILSRAKDAHTESYSMSIGEIKNLYEEGELDLHPEFQRFFRWTDEQKFKLIESILLGIPLPSFFVFQRNDGIWDIVDGLQRLSTIFEFMGILKNEENELVKPLIMGGTKYLPALDKRSWGSEDSETMISDTIKRDFKRKKLDFNIILKQSDDSTKYDLFERLNTGGSSASSQEVRNAILIRENKKVFKILDELASNSDFTETTNLSDTLLEERFDLELITRFIIFKDIELAVLNKTTAADYLTDELIRRAVDKNYDWEREINVFNSTFSIIKKTVDENAFKKYNVKKKKYEGGFVVSAFEVVAMGIAYNIEKIDQQTIATKLPNLWESKDNGTIKWAGRNTTNRLLKTLQFGRTLFSK